MSGQPPGGSGASFIPFITSVTTDIYSRIDKIAQSLSGIQNSMAEVFGGIKLNLEEIVRKINELIEESEMNKEMTLSAFADTTNNLIQQIRIIRNEQIQGLAGPQMKEMIDSLSQTANLLESRMYDIQIAILVNGLHALMNGIKAGRVVGIPVAVASPTVAAPAIAAGQPVAPELAAPVPTLSASEESDDKKSFFGKGVRKKTHDEIMEEKRKKDALFSKYR